MTGPCKVHFKEVMFLQKKPARKKKIHLKYWKF